MRQPTPAELLHLHLPRQVGGQVQLLLKASRAKLPHHSARNIVARKLWARNGPLNAAKTVETNMKTLPHRPDKYILRAVKKPTKNPHVFFNTFDPQNRQTQTQYK